MVDKIFNEGIKNAQAIIIILSEYSVNKPWVKEELNAGFIKRIENGSKLIPIIIDECEVPQCLKSTLWEKIDNLQNYDESFTRILNSIIGHTNKPSLGKLPRYVSDTSIHLPNLTKVDSIIFKVICETGIKNGNIYQISTKNILNSVQKLDIHQSDLQETLDILDGRGLIDATKVLSGNIPVFNITTYGMDEFVKYYYNDFDRIMNSVKYSIVNECLSNIELAKRINESQAIVDHAYNLLKQKGLIDFQMTLDGEKHVYRISPELKRML